MSTSVIVEKGVHIEESTILGKNDQKIPCRPKNGVFTLIDGGTLSLGLAGERTDVSIRDVREKPGDTKPHRATVRQLDGTIVDVFPGETKVFRAERITVIHDE